MYKFVYATKTATNFYKQSEKIENGFLYFDKLQNYFKSFDSKIQIITSIEFADTDCIIDGSNTNINFKVGDSTVMQVTKTGITVGGVIPALDVQPGTAAMPGYTFTGYTGTGFYSAQLAEINFSISSTEKLKIASDTTFSSLFSTQYIIDSATLTASIVENILTVQGILTVPSIKFSNYTISQSSNVLQIQYNLSNLATFSSTTTNIITPAILQANTVFINPAAYSTVANPAIKFNTNSGIYFATGNTIVLSVLGTTNIISVGSSNIISQVRLLASIGSAAVPSISFSADSTSGIYFDSVNSQVSFSIFGSAIFKCGATNNINGVIQFPDGTSSAPSFRFSTGTKGFYLINSQTIGIPDTSTPANSWTLTSTSITSTLVNATFAFANGTTNVWGYGNYLQKVCISTIISAIEFQALNITNDINQQLFQVNTNSLRAPMFTFTSDSTTGFSYDGNVNFMANNVNVISINGTNNSITANTIISGSVPSDGRITLTYSSFGTPANAQLQFNNGIGFYITSGPNYCIGVNSVQRFLMSSTLNSTSNNLLPGANNTYSLGSSALKFTSIWATNGVIQTSDFRLKQQIEDSALGCNFIRELQPKQYKLIEEYKEVSIRDLEKLPDNDFNEREYIYTSVPGTITHYGLLATNVKNAVENLGFTTENFAGYVADGDDKFLNYNEFLSPIIKAIQELNIRADNILRQI